MKKLLIIFSISILAFNSTFSVRNCLKYGIQSKKIKVKNSDEPALKKQKKESCDSSSTSLSNQLIPLSEVIEETDLGELPNNDSNTIMQRIETLNPTLDKSQVTVRLSLKSKNGGQFYSVRPKSNSIYCGSRNVRFQLAGLASSSNQLTPLADVIEETDLGELSNNDSDTIMKRLGDLNPRLNTSQLRINSNFLNKDGSQGARIMVKTNSSMYSGTRSVKYRFAGLASSSNQLTPLAEVMASSSNQLTPLADVIEQTDLGELANDESGTVLQRLAELNPTLDTRQLRIDSIFFNRDGSQGAKIRVRKNSSMYSGTKTVRFRLAGLPSSSNNYINYLLAVPLSEVIEQTDLGELPDDSQETILTALKTLNPNLDKSQLKIKFNFLNKDGSKGAKIIAKTNSSMYSGTKNVRFRLAGLASSSNQLTPLAEVIASSSNQLTPLAKVIEQTDLGELANDESGTVLQRLVELNPTLDKSQVRIESNFLNKDGSKGAKIRVRKNSSMYSGTKTVRFRLVRLASSSNQLTPLTEVIEETDLGELSNNDSDTIMKRLGDLNPRLNTSQLRINSNFLNKDGSQGARIMVKTNSSMYSGTRSVKYRFAGLASSSNQLTPLAEVIASSSNQLTPLAKVIEQTDLGELANDESGTVLQRLVELNPTLDKSQVRIESNFLNKDGSQGAKIRVRKNSSMYSGTKTVRFRLVRLASSSNQLTPLTEVIEQTDLGELPDDNKNTIMKRLGDLNPSLDTSQLSVTDKTLLKSGAWAYKITSKLNNTMYSGTKTVRFRLAGLPSSSNNYINYLLAVPLADVIEQTDLGELPDDSQETILTALKTLNPNLDTSQLRVNNIFFDRDGSQGAKIRTKTNSPMYSGTKTVRFRLAGLPHLTNNYINYLLAVPLADVIEQTDLGELPDDSQETILTALKTLNPNLDTSQLRVNNIFFDRDGSQGAKIGVKTNSSMYSGTRNVRFRLAGLPHLTNNYINYLLSVPLGDVIEQTDLGELTNDDSGPVLQRLAELNPMLDISQVRIESNFLNKDGSQGAKIGVKTNSSMYFGTRNIRYRFVGLPSSSNNYIKYLLAVPLAEVIEQTDLGELPDDNKNTIMQRLGDLNPGLDTSQLSVADKTLLKSGAWSYKITSKLNKTMYSGTKTVRFRLVRLPSSSNQLTPLSEVIEQTNLGELSNDEQDTIIKRLWRLNKMLDLSHVKLQLLTSNENGEQFYSVIPREGSFLYSGSIIIRFRLVGLSSLSIKYINKLLSVPLAEVIEQTDLGELPDDNKNTVMQRLGDLNPRLDTSQLLLADKTLLKSGVWSYKIILKSNNLMYSGSKTVRFRLAGISEPSSSTRERISLTNIILQTNLGQLPINNQKTVLQQVELLNPSLNINQVIAIFSENDNNGIIRWRIIPMANSNYTNSVEVYFTINPNVIVNFLQGPEVILPDNLENYKYDFLDKENSRQNDQNLDLRQENNKIVKKYNTISIAEKQAKLKEIHQHFTNLSADEKKEFKKTLQKIGTKALNDGISISGAKITPNEKKPEVIASTIISGGGLLGVSKMTGVSPIQSLKAVGNTLKNSLSASRSSATLTEAVELTPLLSTSTTEGLTVAETLTTAETVTEGAVLGTEAATSATLAPETLGLSLLIGGLVLIGTGLLYWIFGPSGTPAAKHESHNQYNEVEKYYKFLAHNQLKLSIDSSKWKTISQIYQEYSNNYQAFSNKIKTEIMSFHKEDHSGWGGTITNSDFDILIKVLFDHFDKINTHFMMNSNHGWKIITNTVGSYFIIEEE